MANSASDIQKLYIAYFNRPADPQGLAYWMSSNMSLLDIAQGFSVQPEYTSTYANLSAARIVNTIYMNLFGREAEPSGLNYWTNLLSTGAVTIGFAALTILGGAVGTDRVAVDSKVAAASAFTTAVDTPPEVAGYSGLIPGFTMKMWLGKVVDASTLSTALASVDSTILNLGGGWGGQGRDIVLTNDTVVPRVAQVQLNDALFKSLLAIGWMPGTPLDESLQIRVSDSSSYAPATTGLSLNAAALTAQSSLAITLGRGNNTIQTGSGADRVVLLGNYLKGTYSATENGIALDSRPTSTATARVVTDTINLGAGNDSLVTYGAINLSGSTISNVEGIVSNSAVVITLSQYNALIAARQALALSGPVITFTGSGPHQLTIVDDVPGANNLDLSYISVNGGSLKLDVSSASNAAGGFANNINTTGGVNAIGSAVVFSGTIGTTPVNGEGTPGPISNTIQLTTGGVFNGIAGVIENFIGNAAALSGTTINGNAGDTDKITFTGGGSIVIGGGNTITNIKTLSTENTSTDVYFNVATAGVTNINGGTGNDRVYLANSGNSMLVGNVNLGAGNNTLTMEGKTYTGTFTAGAGASDILSMVNSSNIAAASISGFETLVVSSNASITLNTSQYAAFTTKVATGTNTLTFSNAGTVVGHATVERYVLADGSNTFTAAAGLISVTSGTSADTFTIGDAIITATVGANGINGGAGADVLNIGAVTAALDMSAKVTGIETINVTGGTNAAWTVINENGAGVTLNFTKSAATAINNITLGSGGQTLNILGTGSGAVTITGGAAVDTINLQTAGSGSETLIETGINMSNQTQVDVVGNFNAIGTDYFKTGVNAASVGTRNFSNASTADYLTTIATDLSALLNSTDQAYLITIQAGTASGTYLFQNTGSDTSQFDTTDFFVQLTGTVGTITAGNLIA